MLLPDGSEAVMLPNRSTRWSGIVDGADLILQTNNLERSLFQIYFDIWSVRSPRASTAIITQSSVI